MADTTIAMLTTNVAHAHPTNPIGANKPGKPRTNKIDKGILQSKPATCTNVTARGLPKLWFKVPNNLNKSDAGKPNATTAKYSCTSNCKCAGTCAQSRNVSGCNNTAIPRLDVIRTIYNACRTDWPTAAYFFAPCNSAQIGSSACTIPISPTCTEMYVAEPTDKDARAVSA